MHSIASITLKRHISLLLLICILLILAAGCGKPKIYYVTLIKGERVAKGSDVYLDNQPFATVKDLITKEGAQLAIIQLKKGAYAKKLRIGTFREHRRGTIYLTTAFVKPESSVLLAESVIPVQTEIDHYIKKYSRSLTLKLVAIIGLIMVFSVYIFKHILHFLMLFMALAFALATAYILYPMGEPYVETLYKHLPTTLVGDASHDSFDSHKDGMKSAEGVASKLKVLLHQRPNPEYVSFALIALLSFVAYSILLRAAIPRKA